MFKIWQTKRRDTNTLKTARYKISQKSKTKTILTFPTPQNGLENNIAVYCLQ